jgi:TetR/AcrR family transcriptional regulator, ethionamide resistance regulator
VPAARSAAGTLSGVARAATAKAPRRRRRRPEEAEREILAAAEELLRERPSHEVTVMAVMERTTLSRKSFYVYFRDRHELIARLVAPLRAELDARFEEARAAYENPRDRARASFLEVARVYMEHGALLRALRESSGRDEEAQRVWREFTDPPTAEVAALIRAETKAGRSQSLNPEATARALITMNLGCFFEQLIGKPSADPRPLVETLVEIWDRTIYGGPAGAAPRDE